MGASTEHCPASWIANSGRCFFFAIIAVAWEWSPLNRIHTLCRFSQTLIWWRFGIVVPWKALVMTSTKPQWVAPDYPATNNGGMQHWKLSWTCFLGRLAPACMLKLAHIDKKNFHIGALSKVYQGFVVGRLGRTVSSIISSAGHVLARRLT